MISGEDKNAGGLSLNLKKNICGEVQKTQVVGFIDFSLFFPICFYFYSS